MPQPFPDNSLSGDLRQAAHVAQPHAKNSFSGIIFQSAIPAGAGYVNGLDLEPVSLRVFYDRIRRIKAHWLVVEQGGGEGSQIAHFQECAGISNERETRGVTFRKAI